jgi:hypothetical protein
MAHTIRRERMIVPWLPLLVVCFISFAAISACESFDLSTDEQIHQRQRRRMAAATNVPTSAPVIVEYWPTDPVPSDLPTRNPTSAFGVDPQFIVETTPQPVVTAPIASPSSSKPYTTSPETILDSNAPADATSGGADLAVPLVVISSVAWSLWIATGF